MNSNVILSAVETNLEDFINDECYVSFFKIVSDIKFDFVCSSDSSIFFPKDFSLKYSWFQEKKGINFENFYKTIQKMKEISIDNIPSAESFGILISFDALRKDLFFKSIFRYYFYLKFVEDNDKIVGFSVSNYGERVEIVSFNQKYNRFDSIGETSN